MKIYNLHIIVTEDTPELTDKNRLHKYEYGYYTSLENVKETIIDKMKEIEADMEEFPEYIQKIYCDEIKCDLERRFNKPGY